MGQPFIGEIRLFGGNFAPLGWAFCNGATMAIDQNTALFQLIGTTYGGDGVQTFNLPDLQGRLPVHQGNGFIIGQIAGEENHTLTLNEIANHTHQVSGLATANSKSPSNAAYGGGTTDPIYSAAPSAQMNAGMVAQSGGGQPHSNAMPYLVVSFIISLFGIFPSQS